ncbi:MAG TPA: RNase A-like domain-containing protein [Vicinamibacterales bacterium]|nr:RNase A-like domain-containing protein [Vicinamibacterales bacterium]
MAGGSRAGRASGSLWLASVVVVLIAVGAFQWFRAGDSAGTSQTPVSAPAPQAPSSPPTASRDAAADRRDLSVDEQQGGHTLARHVGKSDQELRDRLARERNISAASSYSSREVAERTVARALAQDRSRVDTWVARIGNRPNLALTYRGEPGVIVGRSIERRRRDPIDCSDAVVVLRWNGRGYYVLTSYPEAGR